MSSEPRLSPESLKARIPRKAFADGFTSKRGEYLYCVLNSFPSMPEHNLRIIAAEIDLLIAKEEKKKSYVRWVLNGKLPEQKP